MIHLENMIPTVLVGPQGKGQLLLYHILGSLYYGQFAAE